jgi:hypothetical protein
MQKRKRHDTVCLKILIEILYTYYAHQSWYTFWLLKQWHYNPVQNSIGIYLIFP